MSRRFELDWLRVLLFALLVPHHVAVGFVDWGVDIYRFTNNQLAGDGMTLFIYWSHSWRLPSLFLIAGIGTWYLARRASGWRFMARRLGRLLGPAIFGTFMLNVFGGFAIAQMTGTAPGFPVFWWGWLTDPAPRQIQHLWFLFNLAIYTVLCWPVLALGARVPRPGSWLVLCMALSVVAVVMWKPHAPALTGNNYQFAFYLCFFLGGYFIGARGADLLEATGAWAWWLLALAVILFLAKAGLLTAVLLEDIETGQALAAGGWRPLGLEPPFSALFSVIEAATAWVWCLAALGLAVRYLAWPSATLAQLNRAVFPVYVLHFPVTLIGLALVAQISLPWLVEFLGLLVFVYVASWALWRLFDRLGPAVVLVGGKPVR